MKVTNINYSLKNEKVRLSAQIVLKSGKTHEVYFEVDKEFKDFIAKDASPFLAATLAICMKKGENLEIDGEISEKLLRSSPEIMKIIESWDLGFNPILLKVKSLKKDLENTEDIGCFFSGGADSFYTYLKNKEKITTLIFVHGFDISVKDQDLYNMIETNIIKIPDSEKIRLVKVKTNLREMFDEYYDWDLSHAFAVSSVALFLRHGFKEIYASCGLPNKNTDHGSMTPELDPLWSTEKMKINHYGCDADKIIKLGFLSNYKLAMENLRVCWVNKKNDYNCCECEKCFRNMMGLYIYDSLEKCKTFNKKLDMDKLRNIWVNEYCLKYYTAILEALKLKNDQTGVTVGVEEFINSNRFPKFQKRLYWNTRNTVRLLDKKYNKNRLYWFFAKKGIVNLRPQIDAINI